MNLNADINTYYKNVVRKTDRLDKETEFELANRFINDGDFEAARILVESNLRFVAFVARSFIGYGLPIDDIIQEGNVGLMKALKGFDTSKDIRLVTYAVTWIRAEIQEYVIKNVRLVKTVTTKEHRKLFFNLRKLKKSNEPLTKEDALDISKKLGIDTTSLYEMELRLNSADVPFDPIDDEDFTSPESYIENEDADPFLIVSKEDEENYNTNRLSVILDSLDDRSKDIIVSRWLSESKPTLHELAEKYEVSYERIRQVESKALKKLKEIF